MFNCYLKKQPIDILFRKYIEHCPLNKIFEHYQLITFGMTWNRQLQRPNDNLNYCRKFKEFNHMHR